MLSGPHVGQDAILSYNGFPKEEANDR
jgi:hypothetical protein